MKKNLFFIFIILSIFIHLFFFTNIRYSIQQPDPVESLKIDLIPPFEKIAALDQKKEVEIEDKPIEKNNQAEAVTQQDDPMINSIVEDDEPTLIKNTQSNVATEPLCELCKPVEEIAIPKDTPSYGEAIKKITYRFKIMYDLGPNKTSMDNVNPLGQSNQYEKQAQTKRVSEIGHVAINYEITDGQYQIDYEARAVGFTSLIFSDGLIQKSQGTINQDGLKPNYYLYQYSKKKRNEAFFDWEHNQLRVLKNNNERMFDLKEGAQDQLSILFQFMFLNPLDKMQVPVTNAKLFKTYDYHYVKEGVMSTVLGDIQYLHIAKFNYEDPDRIDAWLAKDYGYLPIKIAITQDDLSVINHELEVMNIKKNY
jgi:hypothetical protein